MPNSPSKLNGNFLKKVFVGCGSFLQWIHGRFVHGNARYIILIGKLQKLKYSVRFNLRDIFSEFEY